MKFITCTEQLDKYLEKNSIGYYFFKCYTEHVENSSIIGEKGEFWSTAKQTVYEAINEKRNAVQTAIKNGKVRHNFIFFLCDKKLTYVTY